MALVKVGPLAGLPPGSLTEVKVGEQAYALCNAGGAVHAFDGACPHRGGPIGHGALHGNTVVCPWHGWEFDCETAANDFDPDVKLTRIPVHVDGGDIWLDIP